MANSTRGIGTGAKRRSGLPLESMTAGGRVRITWTFLLLLVIPGFLCGCATFYDPPEVRVAGVRVTSLGLTAGTVSLELEVHNPNSRSLRMQGVRYRLDLEGLGDRDGTEGSGSDDGGGADGTTGADDRVLLTEGFDAEGVVLEGGQGTRVTVEMPFEYETVGRTIRALFQGEDVRYHLDAEVRMDGPVGEIRAPIRESGSILDLRPNL